MSENTNNVANVANANVANVANANVANVVESKNVVDTNNIDKVMKGGKRSLYRMYVDFIKKYKFSLFSIVTVIVFYYANKLQAFNKVAEMMKIN